ncbi:MAG TPA: ankyrin repeat domain-containing protein [Polyangiaceae bacterium]|nr:ankyrin repeat domain-containing protein [Polyangiaceae bacterium]
MRMDDEPATSRGEELCDAVRAKDVARVKNLLDAGCDPNIPDLRLGLDGAPALHDAAGSGACDLIALLLRAGADVDGRSASGWTPLMRACNAGEIDAARTLLDAGADPTLRNDEGYTAWGRIPGYCRELSELLAQRDGAGPR